MRFFHGHLAIFTRPIEMRHGKHRKHWFEIEKSAGIRIRLFSLVIWYKHLRNS